MHTGVDANDVAARQGEFEGTSMVRHIVLRQYAYSSSSLPRRL